MAMDPARLPRNRKSAPATPAPPIAKPKPRKAAPKVVPAVERPETPADMKGPHLPINPPAPVGTSGLDPLTLELVQSAPLIPVGATAPPASVQPPDITVPVRPAPRVPGMKTPTVLVVLGGTVAAGLLLALGFRKTRGHSAAAGRTAAPLPAPTPVPSLTNIPTPSAWLKAGGS